MKASIETTKTFQEEYEKIKAKIPECRAYKALEAVKPLLNERPLVLYGAGSLGKRICGICEELGIKVSFFCDHNEEGTCNDVQIIRPETLREKLSNAVVVICSWTYNDEINSTLQGLLGFPNEQIIPCPSEFASWNSPQGFNIHLNGYEWAYNFFNDDLSRQLVLDRISLILLDKGLKVNTKSDCYYEDEFIKLGNHEIFVDGGAFTGDSVISFINTVSKSDVMFHIYSFEPDKGNYELALNNLRGYPNVTIEQKGLWSSEKILTFSEHTTNTLNSSFVNQGGTKTYFVPVTSLDAYFKGKSDNELPSLIKMDIEGAEKEALLGSAEIIKRRKPKLAICAYHKPEDIYELPRIILNIRNDYRFCLRQHEKGQYDTVLYAV